MTHNVEYGLQQNVSLTNARLDDMKAAGARWVRVNIDMAFVYAGATDALYTADTPDYDAIGYDQIVYADSIGLKVLGQLAFCPDWLNGSGSYPSAPPTDYDKFATMCARAYRDLHTYVSAWEIWNEPNGIAFWNEAGTNTYRLLLRKCVLAMRTQADIAGSWSDPFIISGGPMSSGSGSYNWNDTWDRRYDPALTAAGNSSIGTFLDRLFDATNGIVAGTTNGTAYVNGYGIHTYTWGGGPGSWLWPYYENPLRHCFQATGSIGSVNVGNPEFAFWDDIICAHEGYSDPANPPVGHKHLWATENGYPATTGSYTTKGSEAQAAAEMDAVWTYWELFKGAGPMFHFCLKDGGTGDEIEQWGGLYRSSGAVKPIRAVFRTHALNYAPNATPSGARDWSSNSTTWSDPTVTWGGGVVGTSPPTTVTTTKPVTKIEIGLPPTSANYSTGFVIGNATRGKIDGTYTIAPDWVWFDCTNDVTDVQTSRGYSAELDRPEPGTMSVTLRNDRPATARRYDSNNWTSDLFPNWLPRKSMMRYSVDGVTRYCGLVDDIQVEHGNYGRSAVVQVNCVDSMVLLNQETDHTPRHEQDSTDRLNLLLDLANYRRVRFLVPGEETFEAGGTLGNILDAAAAVAQSEGALFFVNPADVFVFLPRATLAAIAPSFTISDDPAETYRYSQLTEQTGSALVFNKIRIVSETETPKNVNVQDHDSISRNGVRRLPDLTLPMVNELRRAYVALLILNNYAIPRTRFKSLTMHPARLSLEDRQALMRLDLGSVVTVERSPIGTGAPGTVTQDCVVIGVSDQTSSSGEFETTLTLKWRNS